MDINNIKVTPLLGGFKRIGKFPIDLYSVFSTKNELLAYLTSEHSTAYLGQLISVVEENKVYYISNQENLIEVAKYSDIESINQQISTINDEIDSLESDLGSEALTRESADTTLSNRIDIISNTASSLSGSLDAISNTVNNLIANSDSDLDTLNKIATWIKTNKENIQNTYTKNETDTKIAQLRSYFDSRLSQAIPGGTIINVTKVSELENDLGYITEADKAELNAKIDLLANDDGLTQKIDSIQEAADKISEIETTLNALDIDNRIDTKLVGYATLQDIPNRDSVTVLSPIGNESDTVLLQSILSPIQGDMAIVTREISTGRITRTGYVYNGSNWAAMDGNYDANNVYLTENITLAGNYSQVGNITKSEMGTATFQTAGKTVAEAFAEIFSKRIQPTIINEPVAAFQSYNGPVNTNVEPGTEISGSVSYQLYLSDTGKYTFDLSTGVGESEEYSLTYQIGETTPQTLNTKSGTFNYNFIVENSPITVAITSTSVGYTAGNIATDNLGDPSSPAVQILAGTKSAGSKSAIFTPTRKSFWAVNNSITPTIDSDVIRAFTNSEFGTKLDYLLEIPDGTKQIIIAVPGSHNIIHCIDIMGLNLDVKENFTKTTISVGGADADENSIGNYAIDYSIFKCENFAGLKPTKYRIILE